MKTALTLPLAPAHAPFMSKLQCRACGTPVEYDEPIPRDAECSGCGRDLRCCMNCRHYDPNLHNACRETEADQVEDRARRNFCEFFSFEQGPFEKKAGAGSREAEARAKLAAMFGGSTPPAGGKSAREKLDALFGGAAPSPDRKADARSKLEALFRKPEAGDDPDTETPQK